MKARARTPQRAENSNEVPEKSLRELQDELKTNIVETSDFAYFDADYFADDEASDSVMTDATQTTESSLEGRITTPAQDPNGKNPKEALYELQKTPKIDAANT